MVMSSLAQGISHSPLDAPRVLLAEDDETMRHLLADVLSQEGFDVVEATNGRELFWAHEIASCIWPIDVIVSDNRMPIYDALDVVEAWAQFGNRPRVVLMSAFPDCHVRARADRIGAVLLEKPFAVERLCTEVRLLLHGTDE